MKYPNKLIVSLLGATILSASVARCADMTVGNLSKLSQTFASEEEFRSHYDSQYPLVKTKTAEARRIANREALVGQQTYTKMGSGGAASNPAATTGLHQPVLIPVGTGAMSAEVMLWKERSEHSERILKTTSARAKALQDTVNTHQSVVDTLEKSVRELREELKTLQDQITAGHYISASEHALKLDAHKLNYIEPLVHADVIDELGKLTLKHTQLEQLHQLLSETPAVKLAREQDEARSIVKEELEEWNKLNYTPELKEETLIQLAADVYGATNGREATTEELEVHLYKTATGDDTLLALLAKS